MAADAEAAATGPAVAALHSHLPAATALAAGSPPVAAALAALLAGPAMLGSGPAAAALAESLSFELWPALVGLLVSGGAAAAPDVGTALLALAEACPPREINLLLLESLETAAAGHEAPVLGALLPALVAVGETVILRVHPLLLQ